MTEPEAAAPAQEVRDDRSEHIEWCKTRALEYVDLGQVQAALTSLYSDLRKHPDTSGHPAVIVGFGLQVSGDLTTAEEVRSFINGVA